MLGKISQAEMSAADFAKFVNLDRPFIVNGVYKDRYPSLTSSEPMFIGSIRMQGQFAGGVVTDDTSNSIETGKFSMDTLTLKNDGIFKGGSGRTALFKISFDRVNRMVKKYKLDYPVFKSHDQENLAEAVEKCFTEWLLDELDYENDFKNGSIREIPYIRNQRSNVPMISNDTVRYWAGKIEEGQIKVTTMRDYMLEEDANLYPEVADIPIHERAIRTMFKQASFELDRDDNGNWTRTSRLRKILSGDNSSEISPVTCPLYSENVFQSKYMMDFNALYHESKINRLMYSRVIDMNGKKATSDFCILLNKNNSEYRVKSDRSVESDKESVDNSKTSAETAPKSESTTTV